MGREEWSQLTPGEGPQEPGFPWGQAGVWGEAGRRQTYGGAGARPMDSLLRVSRSVPFLKAGTVEILGTWENGGSSTSLVLTSLFISCSLKAQASVRSGSQALG